MEIRKKTIWAKDDVFVGELTFSDKNKTKTKKYIEFKRGIVLIVPIEKKSVYLLKEFRPLIGKTVWRIPAGHLKYSENPKKGAERELLEETGLIAKKLTLLSSHKYMGWMKITMYVFKAEGLNKKKKHLEFYEKISTVRVSLKEAKRIALNEMVEIHHAFALLKCLDSKA